MKVFPRKVPSAVAPVFGVSVAISVLRGADVPFPMHTINSLHASVLSYWRLQHLAACFLAVLAAGCANVAPNYTPPERAGNAVVTVNLTKGGVVYYGNGDDCTDPKILAPEHNPTLRTDRSLVVPANKRIALLSLWVSGLTSCHVITSMTLRPDTTYLLSGELKNEQCHVNFTDASKTGASIADEVDLKQMVWGLSTCRPLVQK